MTEISLMDFGNGILFKEYLIENEYALIEL